MSISEEVEELETKLEEAEDEVDSLNKEIDKLKDDLDEEQNKERYCGNCQILIEALDNIRK